jgi:hypothetical protein
MVTCGVNDATCTSFWDLSWQGWIGSVIGGVLSIVVALVVVRTTIKHDRANADRQRAADLDLALAERERTATSRLVAAVQDTVATLERSVELTMFAHEAWSLRAEAIRRLDFELAINLPDVSDQRVVDEVSEFRSIARQFTMWCDLAVAEVGKQWGGVPEGQRADDPRITARGSGSPEFIWLKQYARRTTKRVNDWRRGSTEAHDPGWTWIFETVSYPDGP